MYKIIKYVIVDILRNRIMIAYTIFLLAISTGLLTLQDNPSKGLLGQLNIILIIVPLISIVFSNIYVYHSSEFLELMVSQPLKRTVIWLSLFIGLASSLAIAFFLGAGIPIILFAGSGAGLVMLLTGVILSVIFVALAVLAAVLTRDKAKGVGLSILLWFYFSILFDGIVLFILFQFQDYPLEKVMIGITAFNPVDLSRIMILLKMDISAMMGYTGGVLREYFGNQNGLQISLAILVLWIIVPVWISLRTFQKRDL